MDNVKNSSDFGKVLVPGQEVTYAKLMGGLFAPNIGNTNDTLVSSSTDMNLKMYLSTTDNILYATIKGTRLAIPLSYVKSMVLK